MSGPLSAAIRLDFRLQRRYGFLYAAAFVILLWIVVLRLVPDSLLGPAMPYVLYGDLQFFFFFIAGSVFFEKGERTLSALLTTPMRFRDYLAAKLLTMSVLALGTCAVVIAVDYGLGFDPFALIAGVVPFVLITILAGFVTAPLFPSITEWLMPSSVVLLILNLVALHYSGLFPHPLFYLHPTLSSYLMLGAAFDQVSLTGWQVGYAIAYPVVWVALLCLLARRVFDRYVVAKEGGA